MELHPPLAAHQLLMQAVAVALPMVEERRDQEERVGEVLVIQMLLQEHLAHPTQVEGVVVPLARVHQLAAQAVPAS